MNSTEIINKTGYIVGMNAFVIGGKTLVFHKLGAESNFFPEIAIRSAATVARDVVVPLVSEYFEYKPGDLFGKDAEMVILSCMRTATIYTQLAGLGPYGAFAAVGCLNGIGNAVYPKGYPGGAFLVETAEGFLRGAFLSKTGVVSATQDGAKIGALLDVLILMYDDIILPAVEGLVGWVKLAGTSAEDHTEL